MPVTHSLLFIVYAALLSFPVTRSGFLNRSGISKRSLILLFLLYTAVGCVHTFIAYHYFPNHGDIWEIFNNSVSMKKMLLHNYPAFKKEFFPDDFSIGIAGTHLGWSNYQQMPLALLQMIFNFLSFDNIYINVLLFNFIVLFGRIAFYRMLVMRYPAQSFLCGVIALLIPSVIFWTPVTHKEGLLMFSLGFLLYCLQKIFTGEGNAKKIIIALLMLAMIFITRKAVFIALAPGLMIWWLSERTTLRPRYAAAMVLLVFSALLIFMASLSPAYNLAYQLSSWQHEFLKLNGGSRITLPIVENNTMSFVRALPYALFNGLLMPLPGTGGSRLYNLFTIEILVIWVVIALFIFTNRARLDGFLVGCLVFAITGCLMIGYTIPFVGAIVRYRCIFLPFIIAPFLLNSTISFPRKQINDSSLSN